MPPRRRASSYKRRTRRRTSYANTSRRKAPRRSVRRASSRKKEPCVCPSELTPSARFALAQIDPFDTSSNGAKVPDSNTMPSISSTDIEQIPLAVAADATNAIAFRPQWTYGTVLATPGGGLVTWGAAYATNSANRGKRSAYDGVCEVTRPVAHAIRISSPVAPTAASGFIHIGLSTESTWGEVTWKFPTTTAGMSGLQFYKRVTLASLTQAPLTIINKWLDDTAFRYSSPNSAPLAAATGSEFQTDMSWATIVIMTEGVPINTTVLSAEHLLISEGLPQKAGPIIGSPAAPNSPATLSAVGRMSAETEPFHNEAEQETYIQRGVNALAQGAAEQGSLAYEAIGVPLLRRFGGVAVNLAMRYAAQSIAGTGGIGGVNNNPYRLEL